MNADRRPGANSTAGSDWGFRGMLVAACLVLYLIGTAHQSVFDRDEARFALAVKEMGERGDWLLPSNFGEPRYNKPILCYWLALASTAAFGMNEAALRSPSAFCSVITVLTTMAIAQRLRGRRVARIAGVATATALYLVVEARSLTADASLLAATTISFWAWLRLREAPARPGWWQLLLWASVGLGLLAKVVNVAFLGFAACALAMLEGSWSPRAMRVLLPALAAGALATAIPGFGFVGPAILCAIAVYALVHSLSTPSGRSRWRAVGAPWGAPLALAMFIAWGLPATLATHGGFVSQGLGHHLLGRTATPYEGHSGWPGYYLVATLVAFFPWGSFLPAALTNAWRQRRDSGTAFLVAWVLGPLLLVELTTSKLPHYMLVTFPALAILVAMLVEARLTGARDWTRGERFLEAGIFAVACTGSAVAGGYVAATSDTGGARVAATVLLATSLAVGIIGTIGWFSGRPRKLTALVAGCATTLYLVVFAVFLPALEPSRLGPRLGQAVARDLEPGDRLVLCKVGEASVGFYLPRTPDLMGDPDTVAAELRATPVNALVLVPDDARQLAARLQAGDSGRWVKLDVVDGTILPGLAMRRIQLLRREATATGERD
jgi:4-amino-4-deoxy-L-arabinose transferase-like glycosyltransferase